MNSAISKCTADLEEYLKTVSEFEASVLLNRNGIFKEIQVSRYDHKLRLSEAGDFSRDCADLPTLLLLMAELSSDGKVLIDTLSVRTKPNGQVNANIVSSEDHLHRLTRQVWMTLAQETRTFEPAGDCTERNASLENDLTRFEASSASVWVKYHGFIRELELTSNQHGKFLHIYMRNVPETLHNFHYRAPDLAGAFAALGHLATDGEFFVDTLTVKTREEAGNNMLDVEVASPLYQRCRSFWSGVARIETTGGEDSLSPADVRRDQQKMIKQELGTLLPACLLAGESGVSLWNSRNEKKNFSFEGTNCSGLNLSGISMMSLNFKGSNFAATILRNAWMQNADFSRASLVHCDLSHSNLTGFKAIKADFTGAILTNVRLSQSTLKNAVFKNADVSGVDFGEADLCGVDLTACKGYSTAQFIGAKYDETTKLPSDLPHAQWSKMKWKGQGVDPYKDLMKKNFVSAAPTDFETFIVHIQQHFDKARLGKSLSMLKKESFQLFSEQTEAEVVGVIKSQTDKELVYACRLGFDGTFTCCTQNLKACGGLRGALCKHILVLVIGLTKAGSLDPKLAGQGVLASTVETPNINKDAMSDIFLKYKGVENGEVDWRPTETIPEDYYSF